MSADISTTYAEFMRTQALLNYVYTLKPNTPTEHPKEYPSIHGKLNEAPSVHFRLREREREREKKKERKKEREREQA